MLRSMARKLYRYATPSYDVDDLAGWGQEGLILAADRFDPSRGARFSTYARTYIRGLILQRIREADKQRWNAALKDVHVFFNPTENMAIYSDERGRDRQKIALDFLTVKQALERMPCEAADIFVRVKLFDQTIRDASLAVLGTYHAGDMKNLMTRVRRHLRAALMARPFRRRGPHKPRKG